MVKEIVVNLPDICLYLPIEDVLKVVSFVKKDWNEVLLNQNYVSFWIKSFFNIRDSLNSAKLINIYKNHKLNSVLDFEGWKTDGGVSDKQINSSYSNLWTYNPTIYSTYSSSSDAIPLKRNINCLASFKGGYQEKDNFFRAFNNDLFSISLGTPGTDDEYNLENHVIHKCLTIDPLRIEMFEDFNSFNFDDEVTIFQEFSLTSENFYDIHPAQAPALISKVAIARPFNFSGTVKTLMIIVSDSWKELEFHDFQGFDNIFNLDAARCVAKVKQEMIDDDFNVVEFDRGQAGVYPLLWVEFKHIGCNHLEYELAQAHMVCTVNAKFYDIHDRSEDWRLGSYQPNFDVMYVVMIGSDLSLV